MTSTTIYGDSKSKKDAAGNTIKLGDKVAWATRAGSRAWLLFGTIAEYDVGIHEANPDRRGVIVKTPKGKSVYKSFAEVVLVGSNG